MFDYDLLNDRFGIYQIKNCKNGLVYIGKAVNLYTRWNTHVKELRQHNHHNPGLQRDFIQYGLAAFEFSVIEFLKVRNKTELVFRELHHICTYQGELYNVPRSKDYELYELALMLREQRIPHTLSTRWGSNVFDICIYRDDDCEYVEKIIDVYEDNPQTRITIDKHNRFCLDAGIRYLNIEPNDSWWTRQEVIEF